MFQNVVVKFAISHSEKCPTQIFLLKLVFSPEEIRLNEEGPSINFKEEFLLMKLNIVFRILPALDSSRVWNTFLNLQNAIWIYFIQVL